MTPRRLVLGALALGALALALCPPPHRLVGLAQLAAVLGAALWGPRDSTRWSLANATFIIALAILVAARLPLLLAASLVLGWLAIHRAWTAQQTGALQIGLLLAVLECLVCARLGRPAGLGVLFATLMLVAPVALARLQQRGRQPLVLAAALGAVGALAGVLVPERAEPALAPARGIGFSRDIALGDLGPLHDDPTPLARLSARAPLPEEIYLRGVILDRFTGGGWASSAPEVAAPSRIPDGVPVEAHAVSLEPLTGGVLLGAPPVLDVTGHDGAVVWRDLFGTWRHTGEVRPVRYTAHTAAAPVDETLLSSGRWLGLPADMDPQIRSLAARLKADAPPERDGIISHTVAWLREHYTYTRLPEPQTERQALSAFLFTSKQGHCEYFATALAVLLRAQGVEARVVTGVRGGEVDAGEEVVVFRQRDAHAWVEVYRPGLGWQGVDATPPDLRAPPPLPEAKQAAVIARPVSAQPVSVARVVAGLAVALAAALAVALRRQRGEPLVRAYRRAQRLVARRGWAVPHALPPVAAGRWLIEQAGEDGRPLLTIAELLYRQRYGGEAAGSLAREAARALRQLRRLPRRKLTAGGRRVN